MTYTNHITRIEITQDGTNDLAAAVEVQDAGCASVEIKTVTNETEWADLSAAIRGALRVMKLEGDAA